MMMMGNFVASLKKPGWVKQFSCHYLLRNIYVLVLSTAILCYGTINIGFRNKGLVKKQINFIIFLFIFGIVCDFRICG